MKNFAANTKGIAMTVCLAALMAGQVEIAQADEPVIMDDQLARMSLEDLMNIEVTSVSKSRQRISNAPAAITVISQDDIARSGLHNIPELLRLAPGMDVARIDGNKWAISSRGFNDLFANKLLVLMDGRVVYTSDFSGVNWETQDYVLADVERIEIIRGPGATLWGSNAVNGVINITTRTARETQGALLDVVGGNVDNQASLRYGGKIDEETYYRLYGRFTNTEDFRLANGDQDHDGWHGTWGGFRIDRYPDSSNVLTLQGDIFQSEARENDADPTIGSPIITGGNDLIRSTGGNVLTRWTHTLSSESDFSLQMYYDRRGINHPAVKVTADVFDIDFQHRFPLRRQSIIWGVGFRQVIGHSGFEGQIAFDPADRDDYRLTSFLQDDIAVFPEHLHLILGSKFEQNSYSGFEYQPSGRLVYTPKDRHTFWAGISRAVRTPTNLEQDARIAAARIPQGPDPTLGIDLMGNPDLKSEQLAAYEVGYRLKPTDQLTLDIAAFFNRYTDLVTREAGTPEFVPGPQPMVVIPQVAQNDADAETYGVEVAANWNVNDSWRLSASYSFLDVQMHLHGSSSDVTSEQRAEGGSPANQFQLHSYYNVTRDLEFNASVYYTETLPVFDVPSFVRIDLAMTWRPGKDLSMSVGVQNLLDDRHPEFGDTIAGPSEMPRTLYGQVSWQF